MSHLLLSKRLTDMMLCPHQKKIPTYIQAVEKVQGFCGTSFFCDGSRLSVEKF